MNINTAPDTVVKSSAQVTPGYMSGFGNSFETEALPGALPIGRNSPQRCAYGLAVSPAEVRAAQRFAFSKLHLVVEPGGAAALAAVLAGKVPVDGRTAIVLSGGNTDPESFAKVLQSND